MTIVHVTAAQYAELMRPEYDEPSPKLRALVETIRRRTAARLDAQDAADDPQICPHGACGDRCPWCEADDQ